MLEDLGFEEPIKFASAVKEDFKMNQPKVSKVLDKIASPRQVPENLKSIFKTNQPSILKP